MNVKLFLLFFVLIVAVWGEEEVDEEEEDEDVQIIARAQVISCPGCSLNRLPEVKAFIYEDVPKYENVEFKRVQGLKPDLVFLNEDDGEIERIPLSQLTRKQCNNLLEERGFVQRQKDSTHKEL